LLISSGGKTVITSSFTLHYWNRAICLVPQALGKGPKTLGKQFA